MIIKFCDIVNTVCQSFLFIWVCNNIVSKTNRISKFLSSVLFVLITSDIIIFTYSGLNPTLANFLLLVVILLLLIFFYRKTIIDAFTGFFLTYFLITITTYFTLSFYENYSGRLNLNISADLSMVLFVYIPIFLLYFVFYLLRNVIFNMGMFLKSLKHSIAIIQIITYALLFINTLFIDYITKTMNPLLREVLCITAFLIFIFIALYFAKINEKSKELETLNDALKNKINELKKIKHDYGSELSTLYGLYQLGKIDKLGEVLKNIIERNQAIVPAVSISVKGNSLVGSILNTAVAAHINVINSDDADYMDLSITDNDLLKLISNIVGNSIDALKGVENPVIKYKSYSNSNGVVIIITNNGPEIRHEIIERIFDTGFSTKDNSNESRGFGLSIVKDIINKCNGRINVKSNEQFTQFKLEIPYKTS